MFLLTRGGRSSRKKEGSLSGATLPFVPGGEATKMVDLRRLVFCDTVAAEVKVHPDARLKSSCNCICQWAPLRLLGHHNTKPPPFQLQSALRDDDGVRLSCRSAKEGRNIFRTVLFAIRDQAKVMLRRSMNVYQADSGRSHQSLDEISVAP